MLTEEEFIDRARQFLSEIGGIDPARIDPDTHLVEEKILDSLLFIAFLGFVEEQRGYEMELGPEDLALLSSLRTAYALANPESRR